MSEPSAVNLRRAYFDSRHGQLHVRTAFPNTGGFDERTALVCLHRSPLSSRTYLALLPLVGTDRSVYAVDTPGYGDSDGADAPPSIADYAAAVGDLLDGLRLREIDVLGCQAGAAIAVELAIARPRHVRRLALIGVPVANTTEREAFRAAPWPVPLAADGSHATREWARIAATRGAAPLPALAAAHADSLRNGPHAWWAESAAHEWPATARLPQVQQPTLVLRPKDELWEQTLRAKALLPKVEWQDLPDCGADVLEAAPERVARAVRAFLDR